VGTLVMAAAPEIRGLAGRERGTARPSLRGTRLPWYVGAGLVIVFSFNVVEIGIVAFVSGRHASASAGVVLAVWSVGSIVGGLLFGARIRTDTDVGLAWAMLAMAGGIAATAAAPDTVSLAVIIFVAGATVAPGLARLYSRVGASAPEGAATEAFGWMAVGMLTGASVGAAFGGAGVDLWGPRWTMLLGSAPTFVLTSLALLRWRRQDRARVGEPLPS
jgi:predicted MFS family arabinose efflux permease